MNNLKTATFIVCCCLLWAPLSSAQISDPNNPDLNPENYVPENMYFHAGAYYGLSQPVAADLKHISMSGPIPLEIAKTYEPIFQAMVDRRGVKQYMETDFMVTSLFPESYTNGNTVFIIYKEDSVIEDYFALKKYKQQLIDDGNYDREGRHDVAYRFGQLLSYTDENIKANIEKNDPE